MRRHFENGDSPFHIIKASAGQLPLNGSSIDLVIATPPYIGAYAIAKGDFCTSDPRLYEQMIQAFVSEARRVLVPHGCLLMTPSCPPKGGRPGARQAVFQALAKELNNGDWALRDIGKEIFWTQYRRIPGTCWAAFPVRIYRELLQRYSRKGERIAHVFSGSGNSAVAAFQLERRIFLVDLHYHQSVRMRLRRKCATWNRLDKFT